MAKARYKHADFQLEVRRYLSAHGWVAISVVSGSRRGIADLVATKALMGIWVEVKIKKDTLRVGQLAFCRDVQASGGIYLSVHQKDVKVFREYITQLTEALSLGIPVPQPPKVLVPVLKEMETFQAEAL